MFGKFLGNVCGIALIVGAFLLFVDGALRTPVAEFTKEGTCLRVLNGEGKILESGCKKIKQGQIRAEHRYVAK